MAVADAALLEEYESEKPGRKLTGAAATVVAVLGAGLSLFAVYWVIHPISAQLYRPAFLAVALLLTFLVFGPRERPTWLDWTLGIVALVAAGYAVVVADDLFRRAAVPEPLDVVAGIVTVALVLEATRRTVGWILPAIVLGFIAYAYLGG